MNEGFYLFFLIFRLFKEKDDKSSINYIKVS